MKGRALAAGGATAAGRDADVDVDAAGGATAADRVRAVLVDLLVAGIAAALSSGFLSAAQTSGEVVAGIVACLGLLLRRRWPWLSVLAALPAFSVSVAYVPLVIALFDLGLSRAPRWQVAVAAGGSVVAYMAPLWPPEDVPFLVEPLVDATIYTVGPALLGAFLRERRTAAAQLRELREAQTLGQRQAAEVALARERAVLAREMHDVVSHQVSLIAVQAGAMQVGATDDRSREVARTIRGLSTVTLEELRGMVEVLRAAGGERRELAPQPTLRDVPALVAASGIRATTDIDLPDDLPAAAQRAVYRTVQEGLTNARKHATGAAVRITGRLDAGHVVLEVEAGRATLPPLDLPSGRHGLTGLRERAQLLGGSLTAETRPDGSHLLRLRFPL
ncbi:two-component sensor histidine kinase [Clavibacter nebraskensis]|uniref:histidine kinase n=1 Tax=Clavibacter nebraskensis TaxID=31963 RepID=A0ABY4MSU9_9MICO|nr:two-component sensor histidine kinase [Clavibacter nebraskensis]QGV70752.1 two-component sensor histidine kinase [Clavibacter nebraskensis]QGV73542.1 two-component sensor histidine kinase [Clavibacter nebraskensis]UQB06315.1 two-component sensor histidine kinase [Clavibacter nebraskensis]UQB09138.1 two-component sensor histidine kinase [Clavibacter nebraskensis]